MLTKNQRNKQKKKLRKQRELIEIITRWESCCKGFLTDWSCYCSFGCDSCGISQCCSKCGRIYSDNTLNLIKLYYDRNIAK